MNPKTREGGSREKQKLYSFGSDFQFNFHCQTALLSAFHLYAMRDDRGFLKAFTVALIHSLTLINLE